MSLGRGIQSLGASQIVKISLSLSNSSRQLKGGLVLLLLQCTWFMSDDAEQFFNAWRSVIGPVKNKLLCTWHVDRAWRQKLHFVHDKEMQAAVYRNLRALMEETDKDIFESLLTRTVQQLQVNDSTEEFRQYFKNNYVDRKHE